MTRPRAARRQGREVAIGAAPMQALNDLEQGFAEANSDCARLRALADGLDAYRNNPRFDPHPPGTRADALQRGRRAEERDRWRFARPGVKRARALAAGLAEQGDRFAARATPQAPIADCDRITATPDASPRPARTARLLPSSATSSASPQVAATGQSSTGERPPSRPPPPKPVVLQEPRLPKTSASSPCAATAAEAHH